MTDKECYTILGLAEGADISEVKKNYRKLAFALHPDLHPGIPNAAQRFQTLNEAYVFLTHSLTKVGTSRQVSQKGGRQQDTGTAKAREEAKKAYAKAKKDTATDGSATTANSSAKTAKEEILQDILNDPFARRVFQDIYSHLQKNEHKTNGSHESPDAASAQKKERIFKRMRKKEQSSHGLVTKIKGWLRKQIDDEQTLRLPKESLIPGARIRLEIQHGLSLETQTLELTIPPNFNVEKAIRLKGMGKRVGNWKGDLYVRIDPT